MKAPVISLTCLTIDPKQPAGEIRAEAAERLAQVRALAALAKSTADEHGFAHEIDAHVLSAIEVLADQGAQLLAAADRAEQRRAVTPLTAAAR